MLLPIMIGRLARVPVAVMVHDPSGFNGKRPIDRLRHWTQTESMVLAGRLADALLVSVDPSVIPWTRRLRRRTRRLVVGSNVGENPNGGRPSSAGHSFTVAVFGVTEGPRGRHERELIIEVSRRALQGDRPVRVVAFGRGTEPGNGRWPSVNGVRIEAHGLVSSESASVLLGGANVLLHVRGPVSSRRGAVVAAIAHGLPVVGWRGSETAAPVTEAGVLLFEHGDVHGLVSGLVQIAADDRFASELRRRNLEAWRRYFSWEAIAASFVEALGCLQ